jgi:REP element-mobilizing transposase RayT
MNRGIDHCAVFLDDSDRIEYGQRLADVHDRYGIVTHAYCLMDTHFHHLWQCPDGGLSAAMQRLGSLYTRHVNDRVGRDGALFRGRFHSRSICDEAHLAATVRYIHRNALDLPGVTQARDYRWSSHRTYLGLRRKPPWLQTSPVLDGWEPDEFDRFVDEPLGTSSAPSGLDAGRLIETVELVLAERGLGPDRRVGAVARQIALAYLVDVLEMPEDDVMTMVGVEQRGAMRTALWRARKLMRSEPGLTDAQTRAVGLLSCAPITSRV